MRLSLKKKIQFMKLQYERVTSSIIFKDPLKKINDKYLELDRIIKFLETGISSKRKECEAIFKETVAKLDSLSPLKTLTRGYSLTEKDGKIVHSTSELNSNDEVKIIFSDGSMDARIV